MTKFKKGQSGNPGGKKPGTLNKRTRLATLLEPYAEGLINKTVELAMDGDVNALRLCIERLIPKVTGQQIQIDLQGLDIERSTTLPIIGKKIIDATAKGALSVQDGNQFMHLINTQKEFLAQEELAKRLDEIESHQKTGCFFDELE
ncbi:TPA: DUF5681 domain-containing protein [Legionella pneumophila]|uniref:DUF5681 domain-containing protein n=1 Tax=Legionella pneumophila TaxID=446 RepID=UPI0005C42E83|nr:DUF5681 domain-containing protein [Legionella pneumophila]ANH11621.1 hypothetical protein A5478_00735 [Legionella pneumophila]ANH14590.1 hypothetical protein A5480_00735 [Legionella pneumophila]ANH17556.1 hypothetical protein A5479_00735 [Legionella pneumophila]APX18438.1 hypothetical protein A1D14_00735 [Legionella pneumophila]AQL10617.1 hypothetical protein A1D13_00735 [Legionella pneumophila]